MADLSWERRLLTAGIALLVLGPLLWLATYLPPGTMTSISLLAMSAVSAGALGIASVFVALALRLRT